MRTLSGWSRLLGTTFRSPATTAPVSGTPVAGSPLLVYPFAATPAFRLNRSASNSPPRIRFRYPGRVNVRRPFPGFLPDSSPLPPASAPLRAFQPSGSKRSAGAGLRDSPLRLARSPFAPRSPPPLLDVAKTGSPFQVRYLPPGSLFLEPLGTTSIMQQPAHTVKRKMQLAGRIIATIFLMFTIGYKCSYVDKLCKKQRPNEMFQCSSFRIIPVSVATQRWSAPAAASTARRALAR